MSPQPTVVIADRSEAFLMYLAILLIASRSNRSP